jgi:aryl-alcohol dehydrogenase-like predicted oxidoreductase
VYYLPEVFGVLDALVRAGKLRHYGVSVETVEEALKAIDFPGVQSVQVIYNIFRQRPAELLFRETLARRVGILARLPLSSGLLSGGLTRQTQFAADDHRSFNREGAAFDKGETFSGLDYESGLAAVEALRPLVPAGQTLAQFALRWILMQEAVTCAIPGGRRPKQIEENMRAADLPALSAETMQAVDSIYEKHAKAQVHHRW